MIKGSLTREKNIFFKKGDSVKHKIFGVGQLISVIKAGRDFKLKINFDGNKKDLFSPFVEKI